MKMTKRERFLINLLIYFLLLTVGLYFFIFPVLKRYTAAQDDFSQIAMMEAQMRQSIERIPTAQQRIIELQAEVEALAQPYESPKTNEQLDRIITGLLLRHSLLPVSLSITTPQWLELPPAAGRQAAPVEAAPAPVAEVEKIANAAAELKGTGEPEPAPAAETTTAPAKLLISRLSAEATGDRANLYALVNEVSLSKNLRVISFKVEQQDADEEGAIEQDPLLAAIAATRPELLPTAPIVADGAAMDYKITIDFEVLMYEEQAQKQ